MDPETLIAGMAARAKQLNSPLRTLTFVRVKDCHTAILKLEQELGLPPGPAIYNSVAADDRFRSLSGLLAAKATAAPATAAAKPMIGLAELTELSKLVFGEAETRNLLGNTAAWQHGSAEMKTATEALEAVRSKHGWTSPAASQSAIRRAELSERLKIERAGTEKERFTRLAQNFAANGVSIPGVSYRGLAVAVNGASTKLSTQDKQAAAVVIGEFLSCIDCDADPTALMSDSPAANAACAVLREQGRLNEEGRMIL